MTRGLARAPARTLTLPARRGAGQGFDEVPLAAALAAAARDEGAALLDVREEGADGCDAHPPLVTGRRRVV